MDSETSTATNLHKMEQQVRWHRKRINLVAMVVKTRVEVAEVVRTTTATTKVATEVLELSSYDT